MRKIVLIMLIGLQLLTVSCKNNSITEIASNRKINVAMRSYIEFLNGKRTIKISENYIIGIEDIFGFYGDFSYNMYTFFDINNDEIPELCLNSTGIWECVIISYEDGELYEFFRNVYSTLLNNGAILYKRSGGAPPHISYSYIELDFDGNETYRTYFDVYDSDYDGKYDTFFYDGKEISKNEWEVLTEPFLSIGSDKIEWITYKG